MKVQAVYLKPGEVQAVIIGKINGFHAGDTPDGSLAVLGFNFQFSACAAVERDAPAAGIEYKIQGVGVVIKHGFNDDDTAGELGKRKPGNKFRRSRNKLFLCLGKQRGT